MIKDNIQIEIATVDDADEIIKIQKAAFQGQAQIYDNYQLPPLTQSLESIKNEFNEKTFLKALIKGQIVAAVRFSVRDNYVTIDRIVVKPEHQNQGIGTTLLKEIVSKVPNAVAFQLFTGKKSERNIHLYEKMGYHVINKETTDQGIELLHMEMRP